MRVLWLLTILHFSIFASGTTYESERNNGPFPATGASSIVWPRDFFVGVETNGERKITGSACFAKNPNGEIFIVTADACLPESGGKLLLLKPSNSDNSTLATEAFASIGLPAARHKIGIFGRAVNCCAAFFASSDSMPWIATNDRVSMMTITLPDGVQIETTYSLDAAHNGKSYCACLQLFNFREADSEHVDGSSSPNPVAFLSSYMKTGRISSVPVSFSKRSNNDVSPFGVARWNLGSPLVDENDNLRGVINGGSMAINPFWHSFGRYFQRALVSVPLCYISARTLCLISQLPLGNASKVGLTAAISYLGYGIYSEFINDNQTPNPLTKLSLCCILGRLAASQYLGVRTTDNSTELMSLALLSGNMADYALGRKNDFGKTGFFPFGCGATFAIFE